MMNIPEKYILNKKIPIKEFIPMILSSNIRKNIKNIPKGIYSITNYQKKGVLFCFKHRNLEEKPKSDSSLYPYYLIFVNNDGELLYDNSQAREVVKLFRKICYGKKNHFLI